VAGLKRSNNFLLKIGEEGDYVFGSGERQFATCVLGDSYSAVGILDDAQHEELQNYFDAALAKMPDFDMFRYYFSVKRINVTGMEYVLADVNGEFTALPAGAETERNYTYHISKSGRNIGVLSNDPNSDIESRLFDLIEGELLVMDHHGVPERVSVSEFKRRYVG
jgi:hypothetical protein